MKKLIENISNIWKVEELRKRLLITFSLILVFRIGSFIVLPGVDSSKLATDGAEAGTIEGLLGLLSGGGFTNASFLALGIMPYISASIIMQLMGMAVDRKSTRLNSSHVRISYAVFCLKKKKKKINVNQTF